MDQGILDTIKRHYRKKIMSEAFNEENESKSMAVVKKTNHQRCNSMVS